MKEKTFITTTLPYINSKPHIGHSLEFIQADALTRFFKNVKKNEVRFNTGLDEHGLKVYTKAQELGKSTQEYCDEQAQNWIEFCKLFHIEYDIFYRTTSLEHKTKVQKFWKRCLDKGDLYKKEYTGKYCVGCESFKTNADLVNGKCPDHNVEPVETSEENWFFKITKYTPLLLNWLIQQENFLVPGNKKQELLNLIKDGVDISVSRSVKNVPWGIAVPNDETQVIYVWWEALSNYLFAADYNSEENNFWNGITIQLCGPDNLRFQGHIFQAILESATLPHTKKLLVHGTILDNDGKKMSKSLGNVVDPIEQLNKYGLDAVRYYSLAGIHTCLDGNWNEEDLIKLYNSALADNFGNLIARTLHLIDTKSCEININLVDINFNSIVNMQIGAIKEQWEVLNITKAIELTNSLLQVGNQYMNQQTPWNAENYVTTLNSLYFLIEACTDLLEPVIPTGCTLVRQSLKEKKKSIIFPKFVTK